MPFPGRNPMNEMLQTETNEIEILRARALAALAAGDDELFEALMQEILDVTN